MGSIDTDVKPTHAFSREVMGRLLVIWVPLVVVLGAGLWVLDHQNRMREGIARQYEGAHIVGLQAELMNSRLECCKSDLLFLAENAHMRRFLAGGDPGGSELAREYVLLLSKKMVYDQIRYIDENGWEVVRVDYYQGSPASVSSEDLQFKGRRYYFEPALALDKGEVNMSPLDLNVEHGRIEKPEKSIVRVSTPVFDATGRKRGIIVLNYLGTRVIGEVRAVAANVRGTTMLLSGDGEWLLGPNLEEGWGVVPESDRTFARNYAHAAEKMADLDAGQFRTENGLFTFRTLDRSAEKFHGSAYMPARPGADNRSGAAEQRIASIVFHVPNDALYLASDQALRKFLVIYAIVVLVLSVLIWRAAYISVLRKSGQERLKESEARLRSLSFQLITAQEEERRSISRDVHDDLGQLVTSVSLDLQRVGQRVGAKQKPLIDRALNATQCLLAKVQDISSRLRPPILDDLGLKDAVHSYLINFELETGIDTRFEFEFDRDEVPPVVSESMFRILQEALTNVVKHGHAGTVRVRLELSNDVLTLLISDDGVGFRTDSVRSNSLGMLGMRERAELLGGECTVSSECGKGVEIHVCVPTDNP